MASVSQSHERAPGWADDADAVTLTVQKSRDMLVATKSKC